MKLVIVESPSKAKTIDKYLKDIDPKGDFVVRASVGHVRDLPKSNKQAIDIEGGFVPHYEVSPQKTKVVAELRTLAKEADQIILATDPDREGEAIAWHLKQVLEEPKKSAKNAKRFSRVTYHEITRDAVAEAFAHPRDIDEHLRQAQEARRVLDRLVGYDLSGLIWKKVRYGLSAGRVQSPALRIIMEREREIRAFVPERYFVITAETQTPRKNKLTLTCAEEPRDEAFAQKIIDSVKKDGLTVSDIVESEMKRSTRPPFTTSTLQQAASSRLGYSPSNTMRIAQKLYEAGLITYMRTDSVNLSAGARSAALSYIEKQYGKDYAASHAFKATSKNAQEAHEAIRPTDVTRASAGSTPDQKKLYELIWSRTVASQMADARLLKTKIITNSKDTDIPAFTANGSRVVFDGWLAADPAARGEDVDLPKVDAGNALKLIDITSLEKFTTPPDRYTEAGLIKELEKRGIGRPSTYASIMSTLQDREYVVKEGRSLRPTDVGDVVSTFLEKNFPVYIGDSFTAEMEDELDEIAGGKREYAKTLKDFYGPFHKEVEIKAKEAGKITDLGEAPKEFPCPECGAPMVYKLSRAGRFMSCSRFPDCIGARTEEGAIISKEPSEPIGIYPETSESIYLLDGRFGPYVQVGEAKKGSKKKPRRASVPKEKDPTTVTLEDALHYLALPRTLGLHPATGKEIVASVGRFGSYIVHDGDFRSLKTDDVYTITLDRALEILSEEKKRRGFARKKKAE